MFDDQITLRQLAGAKNAYGVMVLTPTETTIFCRVDSVTGSEFFAAGKNGIHADYRFTVWADEYAGQKEVKYDGKEYRIYRTYKPSEDLIELYAEERVGV